MTRTRFILALDVLPLDNGSAAPDHVRLRAVLKVLGRAYKFRCVRAFELAAHDKDGNPAAALAHALAEDAEDLARLLDAAPANAAADVRRLLDEAGVKVAEAGTILATAGPP